MSVKIKQRDITDCGATCLASVASFFNLQLSIAYIRQIASTDKKGTNVLGMVTAAEKLGFVAKGVKGNRDSLSKIPVPTIAHVIIKGMLSHFLVIYKVKKDTIEYMDPGDGLMHKVSIDKFCETWTGYLILIMPGEDFQEGNRKISNLKRFLYLLQPHKSVLFQCLFGAIIYTVLGLSTSIYIQKLTDKVLPEGNTNLLNLLSVGMLLILLLQTFTGIFQSIFMMKTGQQIDTRLVLGYYKHLLRLPQQFFDTMRVGEILSRIGDAVKIRAFINDVSISLIVNVFIVIFSFALMFVYSWELSLLMLIVIPLYAVLYYITDMLNKKQERKIMETSAELQSQLVESVGSTKTIKQFGIENYTNFKTENKFVLMMQTVYRSGLNGLFTGNTAGFISRLFTILLLWIGSYYVIDNSITPGTLLSFYSIIGYFMGPAASLIGANKTIQNALIASDRLFEIMDLERESEENKIELKKENIGDICFDNISFSYGSRKDIFVDFSLTIPKGKLTAIIGESGSGKTTLASLLQKLYPIRAGKITINGQNIDFFTNESMRKLISAVPQQLNLFSGNIIDNIAVGDFNPDMDKIIQIVKQLGLMPFIENLPRGFNTYIGENGTQLSGGEKQRLAIARALYSDPEVFIFDEATSSLDSKSEEYVKNLIRDLIAEGKTILIIAHRLSTVIDADKIIVLENGKVMEQGSHQELYSAKGRYFQMWEKQMPHRVETLF
ncbi:bacteriocin cleavage/export ABC transporter [Bacteroidia bacterium]|nr:bacteriocin cleavage/export ABC transporter [Bacteroidia bacterium]GHT28612.1 bacteriocin cleavage/export ABC transporter [Bacteroidia bacterium]